MEDLRAKSVFHEIKNQISVCDLYTEVIRRTLEKKGIEDATITRAIKNIQNSLSLIADCANSLREVRLQELRLANLIDDAIEICKAYKEVSFANEISSDTAINADKNKFTSAVVNIIKNAIEAGASKVKFYNRSNDILTTANQFRQEFGKRFLQTVSQQNQTVRASGWYSRKICLRNRGSY